MTSHPLNLISAVISSEKSFLPTLDSHLHPSCPVSTPCFLPKSSLRFSHLSIDLHCFFLLQREGSQGLVPYHLHGTLIHHNAWCTVGQLHFWLGGWMQRKKEQITILCENLKPGKEKGAWEKNGHCFKFNCIPPKLYFEVLTLLPVKVTLSESMVSQMESSSHEVIRMGPNPIGSLSSLGEKKNLDSDREKRLPRDDTGTEGRQSCEEKGRGWSEAATNLSLSLLKERDSAHNTHFELPASTAVREYTAAF